MAECAIFICQSDAELENSKHLQICSKQHFFVKSKRNVLHFHSAFLSKFLVLNQYVQKQSKFQDNKNIFKQEISILTTLNNLWNETIKTSLWQFFVTFDTNHREMSFWENFLISNLGNMCFFSLTSKLWTLTQILI